MIWQNKGGFEILKGIFQKLIYLVIIIIMEFGQDLHLHSMLKLNMFVFFDDDTIPGKKWFENCLETIKQNEGLLGTQGLRFKSKTRYSPNICIGWDNPNIKTEKVDIVGHCWFFKREWLSTFGVNYHQKILVILQGKIYISLIQFKNT